MQAAEVGQQQQSRLGSAAEQLAAPLDGDAQRAELPARLRVEPHPHGAPGVGDPADVVLRPAGEVARDVEDLVVDLVPVRDREQVAAEARLGPVQLAQHEAELAHRPATLGQTGPVMARDPEDDRAAADQVDAVMLAARVLVGVTARSIDEIEHAVTLPQLRVLVMISSLGPLNLTSVAEGLGVHPSNISRACERLVNAGLLDRRDNPADRRNLVLDLTDAGRELIGQVNRSRRSAIEAILARMPRRRRDALVPALRAFAEAAGEQAGPNAWLLGWTTEPPGAVHGAGEPPSSETA